MSGALIVARYALREAVRRRVILVVLFLTVCFLALYALGCAVTFDEVNALAAEDQLDDRVLAGSTLLGLAMFTILFLGAVLAVFLTLGAVRGDAERGLLQPLVVRPVGRTSLLLGPLRRAPAVVCALYVAAGLRRGGADHRHHRRLVAGRRGRPRHRAGARRWW